MILRSVTTSPCGTAVTLKRSATANARMMCAASVPMLLSSWSSSALLLIRPCIGGATAAAVRSITSSARYAAAKTRTRSRYQEHAGGGGKRGSAHTPALRCVANGRDWNRGRRRIRSRSFYKYSHFERQRDNCFFSNSNDFVNIDDVIVAGPRSVPTNGFLSLHERARFSMTEIQSQNRSSLLLWLTNTDCLQSQSSTRNTVINTPARPRARSE